MLKTLKQIDQFYYLFGGVLAVLAIVVIIILKTVFSAFQTANSLDEINFENTTPRIEKSKLDDVYEKLYDRRPPQLDL